MHEPGLHQPPQLAFERVDVCGSDGGQQRQRERATDDRGELRDLLGGARGGRAARSANRAASSAARATPRIARSRAPSASAPRRTAARRRSWRRCAAGSAGRNGRSPDRSWIEPFGVLAGQRAERDLGHLCPRAPGHVERVGPHRHHQEQRRRRGLIDQALEPRQASSRRASADPRRAGRPARARTSPAAAPPARRASPRAAVRAASAAAAGAIGEPAGRAATRTAGAPRSARRPSSGVELLAAASSPWLGRRSSAAADCTTACSGVFCV